MQPMNEAFSVKGILNKLRGTEPINARKKAIESDPSLKAKSATPGQDTIEVSWRYGNCVLAVNPTSHPKYFRVIDVDGTSNFSTGDLVEFKESPTTAGATVFNHTKETVVTISDVSSVTASKEASNPEVKAVAEMNEPKKDETADDDALPKADDELPKSDESNELPAQEGNPNEPKPELEPSDLHKKLSGANLAGEVVHTEDEKPQKDPNHQHIYSGRTESIDFNAMLALVKKVRFR